MVTDEQYKTLQKRVEELERKLNNLSRQYTELYMKRDVEQVGGSGKRLKNSKDTTRYTFRNREYCKRKLVLACVKQYVFDHPQILGSRLEDVFPCYVQGSLGVVRRVDEAEKYSNAVRRYYFSDEDVLHCIDGPYVVCAEWNRDNIDRFIALAGDLGYQIDVKHRKY